MSRPLKVHTQFNVSSGLFDMTIDTYQFSFNHDELSAFIRQIRGIMKEMPHDTPSTATIPLLSKGTLTMQGIKRASMAQYLEYLELVEESYREHISGV